MTNRISQILAVTAMNLRSLPRRASGAVVALVGVAGVVAVLIAVLAIAEGIRSTLSTKGSLDTVLVMRSGSDSEMSSALDLESTKIIADAPGLLRGAGGAVASAELWVIVDVPKKSTGTDANVPLRGVQPAAYDVRGNIRIVEGRKFEPGKNELIAGIGAAQQFSGLDVGSPVKLGKSDWTVVGHFSADGAVAESELWADVKVLQPAYMRGETFQSVYARLESPDAFTTFKDALTSDPRLDVTVMREEDYYVQQSTLILMVTRTLGYVVAGLMAIGAVFGAIITMYSAVASRTREIATLRALGFRGGAVMVSVMVESLLLALVGGLIGGLGAYLAVNGYRASTINWSTFSQVTFAFTVTPSLMAQGIAIALVIGLFAGLFPAIRAARMPVAPALREL